MPTLSKLLWHGDARSRIDRINCALADAAADGWRVVSVTDTVAHGPVVLVEREVTADMHHKSPAMAASAPSLDH